MKTGVSVVAVIFAFLIGCVACGLAAFGMFTAAFALSWLFAAACGLFLIGVGLVVGRIFGRRSRANGLACAVALAAPSLLFAIATAGPLASYVAGTSNEEGFPIAAVVFFGFTVLLGGAAAAASERISKAQ